MQGGKECNQHFLQLQKIKLQEVLRVHLNKQTESPKLLFESILLSINKLLPVNFFLKSLNVYYQVFYDLEGKILTQ